MAGLCKVLGWITFAAGLITAIVAAFAGAAPEGTWNRWAPWSSRWLPALLALVLVALGFFLLRLARRVARGRPDTFLSHDEERQVVAAIAEFEKSTSGEIRVHLTRKADRPLRKAAEETFERLGMTATVRRNGVLFFVDVRAHELVVLGDRGIHEVVEEEFWAAVVERIREAFARRDYARGLVDGIRMAGNALVEHFPPVPDDENELPDTISKED